MASDEFDLDWGDDPFGGDIDFDIDFDSDTKKKGKLKSFATGFLGGLKSNTIGDTDTRIKTLRKVLPSSFSGTFNTVNQMRDYTRNLTEEVKQESVGALKDIQYIVGRSSEKLQKYAPNRIAGGLESFSKHDFSHWEKRESGSSNDKPKLEEGEEYDLERVLNTTKESALMQQGAIFGLGESLNNTIGGIGAKTIGNLSSVNQGIGKLNIGVQKIVDYQRKVQAKNDAMKISLLARMHVTNAKYYKYQEAATHRMIDELQKIVKNSGLSDFQKTSTSQYAKDRMRQGIYNTVSSKFGGIRDFLTEKVGKDARGSFFSGLGGLTGDVRMGMEMSEGMPINMSEMMGGMAAQMFIDNLPRMIQSGKGQEYVQAISKRFPKQAKQFRIMYAKLKDIGNLTSYGVTNAEGVVNTLAKHYSGVDFDNGPKTYQEYVESLPPGSKAMSKAIWTAANLAKKSVKGGTNTLLENMSAAQGSTYNLQRRTLADSGDVTVWSKQNSRTLNEIIPAWLSHIHLSIEKMRTGDDKLKADSYDYSKARFLTSKQSTKNVENQVLNKRQFNTHAQMSKSLAKRVDKNDTLSEEAKNTLAYRLARDADQDLGFVPYNYINLEDEGVPPKIAKEIRDMVKANFDIKDDHIEKFKSGSDFDRASLMLNLPSKRGREHASSLVESAKSLKSFTPGIAKNLDMLRNSGHYDDLRKIGLIKTSNGVESIDMDKVWSVFNDTLKNGYTKDTGLGDYTSGSTRAFTGGNSNSVTNIRNSALDPELVKGLNENLGKLSENLQQSTSTKGKGFDTTDLSSGLSATNTKLDTIIQLNTASNETLAKLLERQPNKVALGGTTETDDKQAGEQKKGIIERLKASKFKDMFNNGMDKLLKSDSLILGGLLGGLAGVAIHDPKAALLLGGGAAVAAGYAKYKGWSGAAKVEDNQDLYDGESDEPTLQAGKLRNGDYYDLVKNKIISSWNQITGAIKDITTGIIIGTKKLAGKFFTKDNKEVFLSGLNKVRQFAMKALKAADPLGRLGVWKDAVVNRFYQMDVYKSNEDSPVLIGKKFQNNEYYKRDKDGKPVVIKGWNEIDGAVYDKDGECLITEEEFERGLKTSMGVSINKMGSAAQAVGSATLGIFGKLKDKAISAGGKGIDAAKDLVKADYSPIVNSIDRIYALLCKHYGYPIDTGTLAEVSPDVKDTIDKMADGKVRSNSLKDQKIKEKEEKDEKFKDAVINMSGELGGLKGDKEKDPKKKQGILGMLFGGLGMLGKGAGFLAEKIFGKTIVNGFKTLFKFAGMGLKVLPMLGKGIMGIGSALMTLLQGKGLASAGGDLLDGLTGRRRGTRNRRSGRSGGRRGGRGLMSKLFKGGGKLGSLARGGVGLAAGLGADYLMDSGIVDEDSVAGHVVNAGATAANVYGGWTMASGAAGMLGVDLGATALAGGSALASGAGALAGPAAALLLNPITLGIVAVGGAAYLGYKWWTKGKGNQLQIRMTQYGIADMDSDLVGKIKAIEGQLQNYVVIQGEKAQFANNTPLEKIFSTLLDDKGDEIAAKNMILWFNGRFKPIYLTYQACIHQTSYKDLDAYDKASDKEVYLVAKQADAGINNIDPLPYKFGGKLLGEQLLNPQDTNVRVKALMEELKKYDDKSNGDTEKTKKSLVVKDAKTMAEDKKKDLQDDLDNSWTTKWYAGPVAWVNRSWKKHQLAKADEEIADLDKAYAPGTTAASIDISDMYKPNQTLDLLTAVRLAVYGNDQDVSWRVEAVLRLERYCEQFMRMDGTNVKYVGKTSEVYKVFKNVFRITDDSESKQWSLWFRDRFLPVMIGYVQGVYQNRGSLPSKSWKSMTATAQYALADNLCSTTVIVEQKVRPVWEIRTSPFPGMFTQSSMRFTTHVDDYLKAMAADSKQAKIKDPLNEKQRTKDVEKRQAAQQAKKVEEQAKNSTNKERVTPPPAALQFAQQGMSGHTFADSGSNANFSSNMLYRNKDVDGSGDMEKIDLSGVKLNSGNDKGVTVPRKTAEQLIIKAMIAQGIRDPRAIALMLAITNHESQGYRTTVESTKYNDPARLVSMFRNVTSLQQAQMLVQQGPEAIAATVYGTGSKARELGNQSPGDGWLYRGRGFIQLTGRSNFRKYGKQIGVDLETNPQLASTDPKVMAKIVASYYANSPRLQSIVKGSSVEYAETGVNGAYPNDAKAEINGLYSQYLGQLNSGQLKPEETGGDETDLSKDSTAVKTAGGDTTTSSGATTPTPDSGVPQGGSPQSPTGSATMSPGGFNPGGGGNTPSSSAAPPNSFGNTSNGVNPQALQSLQNMSGGNGQPSASTQISSYGDLKLKSDETVGGGPVHPGLKKLAEDIQHSVMNFDRFTALNDRYHQSKPGNSKHKAGLALDFTLTNGAAGAALAINSVQRLMRGAGLAQNEYYILNEYQTRTAHTTGGHVHVNFSNNAAAQKYLTSVTPGNAANNTATPTDNRSVPPGVIGNPAGGDESENSNSSPAGVNNVTPPTSASTTQGSYGERPGGNAPPTTPVTNPAASPLSPPTSVPSQPPTQPGAGSATTSEDITKQLAKAIQEGGAGDTELLSQILQQLKEMNQNTKPNARDGMVKVH